MQISAYHCTLCVRHVFLDHNRPFKTEFVLQLGVALVPKGFLRIAEYLPALFENLKCCFDFLGIVELDAGERAVAEGDRHIGRCVGHIDVFAPAHCPSSSRAFGGDQSAAVRLADSYRDLRPSP
jgi:hypothetical protein